MIKVSPKHHQRWLKAKRLELEKSFSKTKALALRKAIISGLDLVKVPKNKWTPTIKTYGKAIENSQVIFYGKETFLKALPIVIGNINPETTIAGFFSPMGDPFLECLITSKTITWRPLVLTAQSLKENRKSYLKKLSLPMKRQAGLVKPSKKSKTQKKSAKKK